jgi:hypothetical protein
MFFIFTGGVGSSEDGPVKKAARKLSIRSRKSGKSTSVTLLELYEYLSLVTDCFIK